MARKPALWAIITGVLAVSILMKGCARRHGAGAPESRAAREARIPRLARSISLRGVAGSVERNGITGRFDHLGYDPATQRLFLAAFSKGALEVIDLKEGKLIQTIDGIPEAQGVAVAPGLKRVFVTSGESGSIIAYDTETLERVASAMAIEDADNVRFDQRSGHVLVGGGSNTAGAVVTLDSSTLARLGAVPLPSHAESFRFSPDDPRMFVNVPGDQYSEDDGFIVVADREKNAVLATWRLKGCARNFPMALDASHDRLFVVGRKPAVVEMLDARTGITLATAPCVEDCDDLFYDAPSGLLLIIGGGGRVSDRAGRMVSEDRPGALDIFAISQQGGLTRTAAIPLPAHTRTGLFVPQRRALYLAAPVQPSADAQILEYIIPD